MKIKLLQLVFLAFLAVSFSTASPAQPSAVAASGTKEEVYKKFLDGFRGTAEQQKAAYEAGKEYLSKYGGVEDQYTKYIKNWNALYEKAILTLDFRKSLSGDKYADTFRYGKSILASEPDQLYALMWLTQTAMREPTGAFDAEATVYALKAIKLIEAGKQPEVADKTGKNVVDWEGFRNREGGLGALNYALGKFSMRAKKYDDSARYFYETAARQNHYAREPATYINLARAYILGEYDTASREYKEIKARPANDPASTERKQADTDKATKKLLRVYDLIVDAYARGVALATAPDFADEKVVWMNTLKTMYQAGGDKTDADLTEYIKGALSKPLPDPAILKTVP